MLGCITPGPKVKVIVSAFTDIYRFIVEFNVITVLLFDASIRRIYATVDGLFTIWVNLQVKLSTIDVLKYIRPIGDRDVEIIEGGGIPITSV